MALLKKILILITLFGLMSFNQYPENLTALRPKYATDTVMHRNKLDDQGKKWGTWQSYSRNGMLILQMNYKDNKLNGEFVRYNGSTGKMIEKGAYLNDLKNGSFTKWYSNGFCTFDGAK